MQCVELTAFDLIALEGDEAKKFLQGQVTCDVDKLSPSHSIQGALCNIKGRVVSDFRLVEFQDTCYLQLAVGMADIVKPVLDKYMVFSRAESRIASSEIQRTGLLGDLHKSPLIQRFKQLPDDNINVASAGDSILIKIPGIAPRYELWQFGSQPSGGNEVIAPATGLIETVSVDRWELEDIRAGIAHITPPHCALHLPEALNYDINGVVSFTKGCYTGQEIVARMYYRGTAKKRLFCGTSTGLQVKPESITCFNSDSNAALAGELISSARDEQGAWFVLAVLPSEAAEADAVVYLNDNPDLPVRLLSLPYAAG
jgi:folate-binding protein YgfZ